MSFKRSVLPYLSPHLCLAGYDLATQGKKQERKKGTGKGCHVGDAKVQIVHFFRSVARRKGKRKNGGIPFWDLKKKESRASSSPG